MAKKTQISAKVARGMAHTTSGKRAFAGAGALSAKGVKSASPPVRQRSAGKPPGKSPTSKLTASLELFLSDTAALPASGVPAAEQLVSFAAVGLASSGLGLEVGQEPTVHLFINCAPDTPSSLPGGIEVYGEGEIRTALVPVSGISALAQLPQITRVSAPRQLEYAMDVARPLVRVPQFQAQTGKGQGVIVGVVDSGIDAAHPAFAGRILKLWDQTIPGPGPGASFVKKGLVLAGAQMAASRDTVGHGTHVAGIAVGDGSPFQGVAPEAEIVVVKTTMTNSDIAEGVRWVFAQAQTLGRPAVVNLSLGGHMDGHDGRDDLSRALDGMCGPGRIVVAAAGNEGDDAMHSKRELAAGTTTVFELKVEPKTSNLPLPFFVLSGWYSGTGKCRVRVVSSMGQATVWQAVGAAPSATILGQDQANIVTTDVTAGNTDRQFLVQVRSLSADSRVQGGTWRLEVKRSSGTPGTLHVWLLRGGAPAQAIRFISPNFSELIGSPGAATQIVTVASYTSRNQWTNVGGQTLAAGLPPDTISPFSSPGPRRDGGLKPDVAAPGAMIVSCEASTWDASTQQKDAMRVAPGWRVDAGTSMASPFIAGVLACLMKTEPLLTPQAAKDWLKGRSKVPGGAVGVHDSKWGFGLLKI